MNVEPAPFMDRAKEKEVGMANKERERNKGFNFNMGFLLCRVKRDSQNHGRKGELSIGLLRAPSFQINCFPSSRTVQVF